MEPYLASRNGSMLIAIQHDVAFRARLVLGEASLMAVKKLSALDLELRRQERMLPCRCITRSHKADGGEAVRLGELRDVMRRHLAQNRPLENAGVADLVCVAFHHAVFPLMHPTSGQATELSQVLGQVH